MLGQYLMKSDYARLLSSAKQEQEPLLTIPYSETLEKYNKQPYLVSHALQDDKLFSLESICQLAKRLPEGYVTIRRGKMADDAPIDSCFDSDRSLSIDDIVVGLSERRLYLYVPNPEKDPAYREILLRLLGTIAAATEPVDGRITWYSAYFFVSSEESVTPYHMDREMNYLLQIAGTKSVRLWDPSNHLVLTEAEKDRMLGYAGDRPTLRAELESLSSHYLLTPGVGVHHPFMAPHLVKTSSQLSISLAFTFRTVHSDTRTQAHHFNHLLRRVGLSPHPIDGYGLRTQLKSKALRAYVNARRLMPRHHARADTAS